MMEEKATQQTKEIMGAEEVSVIRLPEKIAICMIAASLFVFGVLFFVLPKKTFSENENRNLAKFPAWNITELTGGVYTGKVETYIADHFPARDAWMALATEGERLTGKKLINGVYLAKSQYVTRDGETVTRTRLVDAYETPQYTDRAINSFVRLANALPEDVTMELMLVPTAELIYQSDLPANRPEEADRQLQVIDEIYGEVTAQTDGRVLTIDVARSRLGLLWERKRYERLRSHSDNQADFIKTEQYYYATDHHWTVRGAYAGYDVWHEATIHDVATSQQFINRRRAKAYWVEEFEPVYYRTVSTDFRGTTWSKLNDPYFAPDTIDAYFDPDWDITVTYTDTGVQTDTPYNDEWLSKKDQYSYFLDGIHPLVIIENHAAPEDQGAIAIVKDSYGNCMIPFMISQFRTIYVFDTRYYRDGISAFVEEHEDIGEVLVLYNLGTMDTDAGIGGIF